MEGRVKSEREDEDGEEEVGEEVTVTQLSLLSSMGREELITDSSICEVCGEWGAFRALSSMYHRWLFSLSSCAMVALNS